MAKDTSLVALTTSKWVLASLWIGGGLLLILIMLWLTFGHYITDSKDVETAVKWLAANIGPTFGLISGVIVFDATENSKKTTRMVDRWAFNLSFILSFFYLGIIAAHLVIPIIKYPDQVEIQVMSFIGRTEILMSLIQGAVVATLGIFFLRNEPIK